jgi:hypothetical protein
MRKGAEVLANLFDSRCWDAAVSGVDQQPQRHVDGTKALGSTGDRTSGRAAGFVFSYGSDLD